MIGFRDSLTLAYTKLRTKRIRLSITTVISAMMFGLLLGVIIIGSGAIRSATEYTKSSNNGRYLVAAMPKTPDSLYSIPSDTDSMTQILKLHNDYIAERTAAAKKYGITYDPKSETQPFLENGTGTPTAKISKDVYVNGQSVAYQRFEDAQIKAFVTNNDISSNHLRTEAVPYGLNAIYTPQMLGNRSLIYLKNGIDDITQETNQSMAGVSNEEYMASAVQQSNYTLMDDTLLSSYQLPIPDAKRVKTAVPVMLSVTEAVKLFGAAQGISAIPKKPADQIVWMNTVREKLAGLTYTACYRNSSEQVLLQTARQQATEIAANKNNSDYVKPPLIYRVPTTTCGGVEVASDTRSAAEKAETIKQQNFNREFGQYTDPVHDLVTFQIVGLLPMTSGSVPTDLSGLVTMLVSTNYSAAAAIPRSQYQALSTADQHTAAFKSDSGTMVMLSQSFLLEFPSADSAKKYINEKGCSGYDMSGCGAKLFVTVTFGSNYLLVDEIAKQSEAPLSIMFTVEMVIATIIILAMMGRVMADSRRETAVFRALGARRRDISAVYLLYSFIVALRIVALSLLLGIVMALIADVCWSRDMSDYASVSYGLFDSTRQFHFLGFDSPLIWQILVCIVVMGLVAVIIPLLRNVRRNPIRDMRDE